MARRAERSPIDTRRHETTSGVPSSGPLASEAAPTCGGCNQEMLPARTIQTKLRVSQPGDESEKEADRISERVTGGGPPSIQRACACGSTSSCDCETPTVMRSAAPSAPSSSLATPNCPKSVARTLEGNGRPLDKPVRREMEQRFGHDFDHVRVHTGEAAEASARDLDAHAYTTGHHVVFGPGQYAPTHTSGRRLLAHELTHVVQQSSTSSAGPVLQRKGIDVAGCGMLDLAASVTDIGGAAHEQIQDYLLARGVGREFWIPRATKQPFPLKVLDTRCQKSGTVGGRADLVKSRVAGYEFGEIKSIKEKTRAKMEARHYVRRASQSMQRVFKVGGSCAKRPAGADDLGFVSVIGATPMTTFSTLSGVLSGNETIGPFSGNPSLTLKVKEIGSGGICYWCTKDSSKSSKPAKPPGPAVGLGFTIGGPPGGAYNAGVGVAILPEGATFATAGAGVSYKADTKVAGAAGASASSESSAVGALEVGASATSGSQSLGGGVAGASKSQESLSATAGAAGTSSSSDSLTGAAGVAGQSTVSDSATASAGGKGSAKAEGVSGASTGSPPKPVDVKEGESRSGAQQSSATQQSVADAGIGPERPDAGEPESQAEGRDAGTASSEGTGQGADAGHAEAAPDAGTDPGTSADAGQPQAAGGRKIQGGLGVVPIVGRTATDADRQKAEEETAKVADLISKASPGQLALLRQLAKASPNGQYVVPASAWVATMMKATEGLSEEDVKYLQTLDWSPTDTTSEEMKKNIEETLKTKRPASSESSAVQEPEQGAKGTGSDAGSKVEGEKGAAGTAEQGGAGTGGKKATGGDVGGEKAPEQEMKGSGYVQGRTYSGSITSADDTKFELLAGDKITSRTRKGDRLTLEVRWVEGDATKRSLVQYEVVAGPIVEAQTLRFNLRSTNAEPLSMSDVVLPAHAPAYYSIPKGK